MRASASRACSITSEAVLHSASRTSNPASAKTRCSGSMLSWSQSVITILGDAAFKSPSFLHRGPVRAATDRGSRGPPCCPYQDRRLLVADQAVLADFGVAAHRATCIRVGLRFHFALLVAHLALFRQSRSEPSLEHPCCPYARTWLYSVKSLFPSS